MPASTVPSFHSAQGKLDVSVVSEEIGELPGKGDVRISALIKSNGFRGHNDISLDGKDFDSFCRALIALEASRQGEAKIAGMSPNAFELTIGSLDFLGHIGVWGKTGYHVMSPRKDFFHAVEFGFEVEPGQLQQAAKNELVRRRGT